MPRYIKDVGARLDLSRRTIETWERIGRPGGRAEDNLRMIREELKILADLAKERPGAKAAVQELSARYGAMANIIRLSTN